ncbi:hypothetical protein ABW19_dt0210107 [Dactylella cylindrospora]|nr:hypothetical protein ABW19_dt0210107 [Dactylella cylindrospora]
MEANQTFSPATTFPLSFFVEDMMLFTGSADASDLAAAWADMGMGQGRSVSSIMDPYHLEIPPPGAVGGPSPLQSPLNLSAVDGSMANGGFLSPTSGLVRTGTKRGSNIDMSANGAGSIVTGKSMPVDNTGDEETSAPAQKRRRRDTIVSSDDDTGASGIEGRRESFAGDGKRPERPRLTEEEKKNNHIASEQKRRMAIRDGFDRLTELVPGIEGQGRSESIVLRKTVDHMRQVIEERRNLIQRVQELGGEVPPELLLR